VFEFLWGRKGYKYSNTRRWLRLPAAWPVKCAFDAPGQESRVVESVDVGAGGISVTVQQNIPVGNRIQLEVYAPPLERFFRVEGQVVRSIALSKGGYELGIRFIQMDSKDQQALNEAVERFYKPRERARQKEGEWWRNLP